MADIGGLNYNIGVDLSQLVAGLAKQEKLMQDMVKKLDKNLKKGVKSLNKAGNDTSKDNSFMSPGWFASRARWFVQLRAFWTIWQGLKKAVAGAFEFEQQIANVRAITQATDDQFEALRKKALEVGKTTRFSASEAAKGMVVMSQAGLSVAEILSSIENVANLATATLYDFQETASLVVTIMRAWNLTAEDSAEITDTLATAINKTKLNMDSLRVGFNYVAGIAPQMNLSLQETTALLGTLANRGLSASTAATSLRAIMAALLNPTDKFKKTLKDLGVSAEEVDPRFNELTTIFKRLRAAGFGVAEAFTAFRRRAASGAAILIKSVDETENLSKGMLEVGRAARMAEINLETVQGQMKQFQDNLVAAADSIANTLDPAIRDTIKATKILVVGLLTAFIPIAKVISEVVKGFELLAVVATKGIEGLTTRDFVDDIRRMGDRLKEAKEKMQDLVTAGNALKRTQEEIRRTSEDAVKADDLGRKTDLMKKAVKLSIEQKLLTKTQAEDILQIKDVEQQRRKLIELTNKVLDQQIIENARIYNQEKTIAQVHEEGIHDAVLTTLKDSVLQYKESEKIAKAKEQEVKALTKATMAQKKLKEEIDNTGDSRLQNIRKLAKESKAFGTPLAEGREKALTPVLEAANKAYGDLSQQAKEKFEVIYERIRKLAEVDASSVELLIKSLGEDYRNFITAIVQTPNIEEFSKTYSKLSVKILKTTKAVKKDYEDQLEAADKLPSLLKKSEEERSNDLKGANALLKVEIDRLKMQKKWLEEAENTNKNRKALYDIESLITEKENKIVDNNIKLEKLSAKESIGKIESLKLTKEKNNEELKYYEILLKRKAIEEALNEISKTEKGRLVDMKMANDLQELRGKQDYDILKSEEKLLEFQKENLEIQLVEINNLDSNEDRRKKILDLALQIKQYDADIAVNLEKQRLATDAIARRRAETAKSPLNVKTFSQFLNNQGAVFDTLFSSMENAAEPALTKIANLFSEQKAEAKGLQVELEGLNEEYQQALSEGNIERAKELETQMSLLKNNIEDLNSPIKNLTNTFREFALSVVQELQKVIVKMLIISLLSKIFGAGAPNLGGAGAGASNMGILLDANGGVLPGGTFKSFRKFANGGVTGGAGMAVLGDNASGKELVIPSENIKNDEVSGHVRNSGTPINIINVLTQQDIARAMSGLEGQKVIVNTIGADLNKRGPTYRAVRS